MAGPARGALPLGIEGDQSIISALSTRILRPGSSGDLDTLVAQLLTLWDDTEESLGIEVELRVFAYLAASDADVRRRLNAAVQRHGGQPGWEIGQIVGLLWPCGTRLRSAALQTYSPYAQFEPTERLLFGDITATRGTLVDASSTRWRAELDEALRTEGSATVRAETDTVAAGAIRDLLTEPTSVDVLEFHPRVVGITRTSDGLDVLVELREARQ